MRSPRQSADGQGEIDLQLHRMRCDEPEVARQVPGLRRLEHARRVGRRERRQAALCARPRPAAGRGGGDARRDRRHRRRAPSDRHRGVRPRARRRHRRRRRRPDRRRPGDRQVDPAAAGARRAGAVDEGALRHRRGKRRAGRAALAPARPRREPGARAGRDPAREDPGDARGRAAGGRGDRFDPDRLQRGADVGARLGRAGARMRRAADADGQGDRHHDHPGRPRHQGRRARRAARDGAHRRHRALFRGRHALELSPRPRDQEPLRRGQRDRRLRDDREGPEGRQQPERDLPVDARRAGAGLVRPRHARGDAADAGRGAGARRRRRARARAGSRSASSATAWR